MVYVSKRSSITASETSIRSGGIAIRAEIVSEGSGADPRLGILPEPGDAFGPEKKSLCLVPYRSLRRSGDGS